MLLCIYVCIYKYIKSFSSSIQSKKQLIRNKIAPDMNLGHSDVKKDDSKQNVTNTDDSTTTSNERCETCK